MSFRLPCYMQRPYLLSGIFSGAGTREAHNVAVTDGRHWIEHNTPVGRGLSAEEQAAYDLPFRTGLVTDAAVFQGKLYICGTIKINPNPGMSLTFDTVHLAWWDDDAGEWVPVGDGSEFYADTCGALWVFDGKLLVGGLNDDTNVLAYDGSSFTNFGSVSGSEALGQVLRLYEWGGWVYAGTTGSAGFSDLSGASCLRSDGSAWAVVGGSSGVTGQTWALEAHNDGTGEKLYIGGTFSQSISSVTRRFLTRFTGSSMEHVWLRGTQSGMNNVSGGNVRALCSYGGVLLIGGINLSPGTIHAFYDSQKIVEMPVTLGHHSSGGSTPAPFVSDIVRYGDSVLFGGQFFTGTLQDVGILIRRVCRLNPFDDVYEPIVGQGFDATCRTLVVFDGALYAVGDFDGYFARLEETGWVTLESPGGAVLDAVTATIDGTPYLVLCGAWGVTTWDGTALAVLATSTGTVRRLRVDAGGDIIAVGSYTVLGGVAATGIARIYYDSGIEIEPYATTLSHSSGTPRINDVHYDGTYVYAVGLFGTIANSEGSISPANVARMDISTGAWSTMSSGLTTECYACQYFNSLLFVSVDATSALRYWDGSSFGFVSGSFTPTRAPRLLRTIGGLLYIDMTSSAGSHVVTYDGTDAPTSAATFSRVAAGNPEDADNGQFDRPVHTGVLFDGRLHFGGEFVSAGTRRAPYTVPAQCVIRLDRSFTWQGFLGGIGEKLAETAFGFGSATSVRRLRVMDVASSGPNSVVACGSFLVANDVRSNGIAGMTASRATAIGVGVGPMSTTSTITGGRGCNDAITLSDGHRFTCGDFDWGLNPTPDPAHEEAGPRVMSRAIVEIVGRRFKQVAGYDDDADDDGLDFPVLRDTLVNQSTPTQNYGDSPVLVTGIATGEFRHALLYVDLRDLGPVIGDNIASASLNLECSTAAPSAHDFTVAILNPAVAWNEMDIDWDSFAASHTVIDTAALTFAAPESTGPVTLNVTTLVRWILDTYGAIRVTLILRKALSGNNSFEVYSREETEPSYRPTLTVTVKNTDITVGYSLVEFGDEDGVPLLWMSHDGAEHISRYNHVTREWIRRGSNIEASNFLPRGLIVFDGKIYHFGSARLSASPGTDRTLIRSSGNGTWEDVSVSGMVTCLGAAVTALDDTPTLVVCGSMSGSQNSVWKSTDGSTWTPVGPTFTDMPAPATAIRVSSDGVAWVDFSPLGIAYGPTLVATACTIGTSDSESNVYQAAVYDEANDDWLPLADFDLTAGFWRAWSVRGRAIIGYERTGPVRTQNPDSGKLIVDGLAEWNPATGWRRLGGSGGLNDVTRTARA